MGGRPGLPCWPAARDLSGVDWLAVLVMLPGLELEELLGVAAKDVALGLLVEERQVVDRRRQVEVPVRIVGREAKLCLGVDRVERGFKQLAIAGELERLRRIVLLGHVLARQALAQ